MFKDYTLVLIVLSVFSGCAIKGTTSRGWNYQTPQNSITEQEIEIVTNVTLQVFERMTGKKVPAEAWAQVDTVKFTYFEIFCDGNMGDLSGRLGNCYGLTDWKDKEMMVTLHSQCLANTSLSHELIHVFAKSLGLPYSHGTKGAAEFFISDAKKDERKQTVEYVAKTASARALNCKEIRLF